MKIWLWAAILAALASSIFLNGGAITVAIVVNLVIWGLLGAAIWRLAKYLLARDCRL